MSPLKSERNAQYVARLEDAFNKLVRYIAAAVAEEQEKAPGPLLSGSQRIVLRALASGGPCQVSEVAGHLGVTLSAATGLVDRLVKAKLVTRERDQKDRRVVWVRVTPDGVSAVEAAEQRRRIALGHLVADLPEEDLASLCDILERIN